MESGGGSRSGVWQVPPTAKSMAAQSTISLRVSGRGSKKNELRNYRAIGNLGTRGELVRAIIRKPGGDSLYITFYS